MVQGVHNETTLIYIHPIHTYCNKPYLSKQVGTGLAQLRRHFGQLLLFRSQGGF